MNLVYAHHKCNNDRSPKIKVYPNNKIPKLKYIFTVCLPALPWISGTKLMLDNNPHLHHVPYLVGCQQSILNYSSQASWAVVAGIPLKDLLWVILFLKNFNFWNTASIGIPDRSYRVSQKKMFHVPLVPIRLIQSLWNWNIAISKSWKGTFFLGHPVKRGKQT